MEYQVGSLADLISGSTTKKKSKHQKSGVKIIFQAEENTSPKQKKKKHSAVNNTEFDESPNYKRKRSVEESDYVDHKKKRKKTEVFADDVATEEYAADSFEETNDSKNFKGKELASSEYFHNAEKRIKGKEKKNKTPHPIDEEKESRTVFVKNIPYTLKKYKVQKFFQKYGPIESVRFRCAAVADPRVPKKVAVIKNKFHPDRTNICAFICFESVNSADRALAANGVVIGDHHILVDKATEGRDHDQRKAIFLGNLSFGAEEDDLWNMFEGCGKIVDIRIIRARSTGIGKGFGYVNFESPDAVELALKLDGEKLKGRELRVSRASKKPKPTSKPNPTFPPRKHQKLQEKKFASQYRGSEFSEDGYKKAPKYYKNSEEMQMEPKHIKLENAEEKVTSKKTSQYSVFQGQTMFDKKKKKHKKKLSKEELKKKMVIKKLGIESSASTISVNIMPLIVNRTYVHQ